MKGFTLIEMLAVMVLIVLLSLFSIPFIQNQISNRKADLNDANLSIIYAAAELYMDNNEVKKCSKQNDTYCVSLDKLVNEGYLDSNIMNFENGEKIALNNYVKVEFNNFNEYNNYEITDICEITVECE